MAKPLAGLLWLLWCLGAAAQGTTFTYQGRLQEANHPANGFYDMTFALFTSQVGGSQAGWTITNTHIPVSNGLFTVPLDFGASFDGTPRWLQIAVATNGSTQFTALTPRQALTPTPYAMHAGSVTASGIIGSISAPMLAPGAAASNLVQSGQSPVTSGAVLMASQDNDTNLLAAGYTRVGGYVPALNLWRQKNSQSAPSPRTGHCAVWTGTKMIVWGGRYGNDNPSYPPPADYRIDGGIYDPANNLWAPISTNGAPTGREGSTAVWTGNEMAIWGGYFYNGSYNYHRDGARYNPALNTWTAINTNGAPTSRYKHTAVWTGTEIIVWGGMASAGGGAPWITYNDGARYNPTSNTWSPVSSDGAPTPRMAHTAVWTGTEMLVWGGQGGSGLDIPRNDGARYNPTTDTWSPINTTNSPGAGWIAVWTGNEMIVLQDGGGARYNPQNDTWRFVTSILAPSNRLRSTAVWTGREMMVWGGNNRNDGACYDPALDAWTTLATTPVAPAGRSGHTAVWTGSEMLTFGGTDGSTWYADAWSCTPPKAMFLYIRQ